MKISSYLLAICIVLTLSCDKKDVKKSCYSGNPLEELEWLTTLIKSLESSSIYEFLYITEANDNDETVFILGNCCPHCNSVFTVYNCTGEEIGNLGKGKDNVNPDNLENEKVVWRPNNSPCNLD